MTELDTGYRKYVVVIALLSLVLGIKSMFNVNDDELDAPYSMDALSQEKYRLFVDDGVEHGLIKDIFTGSIEHKTTMQPATIHISDKLKPRKETAKSQITTTQIEATPTLDGGEIGRIKLLGIVFHDNKKKAYLALDGHKQISGVNELLNGRYLLREILVDSVEIFDTKNNQTRNIIISGK